MMKSISAVSFDVMLNDRFVCQMRMPITLDCVEGYDGDIPIIDSKAFADYVENRRPSLKGKDYNIIFISNKDNAIQPFFRS